MAGEEDKPVVKIDLTPEQREQLWRVLGNEVAWLELTPELDLKTAALGEGSKRRMKRCRWSVAVLDG